MTNIVKLFGVVFFLAIIGVSMTACDNPAASSSSGRPVLTGSVIIDNTTPRVGDTLTASYIPGNGSGASTWQWLRDDEIVPGVTSSSYTVVAADLGMKLRAGVSFAKQSGFVLSDPTSAITPPGEYPVASDFDIGNLTQTVGSVTAVLITPIDGKSTGYITIYYNGSTDLPSEAGTYTVTFDVAAAAGWNAASGLSGGTLTVKPRVNAQIPHISSQPMNATVAVGTVYSLTVTASVDDGGTLTYQWYSNKSASNSNGTPIEGKTSDTYNPPTGTEEVFYYYVVITNTIPDNDDGGIKTAEVMSDTATLTVNNLVNAQIPGIIKHPQSAEILVYDSDSLTVTASVDDGGTLTFQWYSNKSASNSNGTPIEDEISETYDPPVDTAGTFYYYVTVTNTIPDNDDGGSKTAEVRSNAATITVNPRTIGITGVQAEDRKYDGTNTVALSGGDLTGVIEGDDVGFLLGNGTIANPGPGNNIPVTVNIQLTGNQAGNYILTQPGGITVNITAENSFFVTFADFSDIDMPAISAGIIYLIGGTGRPTSASITVANPQQYDAGSIKWYFNKTLITTGISGTHGNVLTVNSTIYNRIGLYSVIVEAEIGGRLYSRNVNFEVKP